jgi:hypothetical protein
MVSLCRYIAATLSRVALGHRPSTKQAGAGALLIVGLVVLCVLDGGTNWGVAEGGAVVGLYSCYMSGHVIFLGLAGVRVRVCASDPLIPRNM